MLRFSLLANDKPINHIEQCLPGSRSSGGNASGLTCAKVICGFLSNVPVYFIIFEVINKKIGKTINLEFQVMIT